MDKKTKLIDSLSVINDVNFDAVSSQKEMAEIVMNALKEPKTETVVKTFVSEARKEFVKEKEQHEEYIQEALGNKGYLISVPNTEIILYEDDNYQLVYCNSVENPARVLFGMAIKKTLGKITGRTAVTTQGYVFHHLSKEVFNLILASLQKSADIIKAYKKKAQELEKELAPLRYIDYLIKKYKVDTADEPTV